MYKHSFFRFPLLMSFLLVLNISPSALAQSVNFTSDRATCANANANLAPVTVQPYCDNAIIVVCSTVNATLAAGGMLADYKAVGNNLLSPCEIQILFYEPLPAFTFDYDLCVKDFESITIDCMLIGKGKYAGEGHQAGVRGVVFNPGLGFSALHASSPGYLAGPPDYYPVASEPVDLTDTLVGNSQGR
ncbi:MAG: hypothetical protein L6R39_000360 [Caloplaca ligustica]|nr:MAG: hypothetical protein L6R39_000360 [Caloplaca ligustica]